MFLSTHAEWGTLWISSCLLYVPFWDIELYPFNPFWWCFCGNSVESLLAFSMCLLRHWTVSFQPTLMMLLWESRWISSCPFCVSFWEWEIGCMFGIYNFFPLLVEKILMLHYLKLGLELIIFQIVGLYHDKFKDQSRLSYSSLLCNQISY